MDVDHAFGSESIQTYNIALVGKLYSRKATNMEAMQKVLSQVWKLNKRMRVNEGDFLGIEKSEHHSGTIPMQHDAMDIGNTARVQGNVGAIDDANQSETEDGLQN
ncbi:hypothetical protein REPUB_Repub09cG0060500 [Reevesia pubescens]